MYSDGAIVVQDLARSAFQFLSRRHISDGSQVQPPSTIVTRSSGNSAKVPSEIKLVSWDWKTCDIPTASSA